MPPLLTALFKFTPRRCKLSGLTDTIVRKFISEEVIITKYQIKRKK